MNCGHRSQSSSLSCSHSSASSCDIHTPSLWISFALCLTQARGGMKDAPTTVGFLLCPGFIVRTLDAKQCLHPSKQFGWIPTSQILDTSATMKLFPACFHNLGQRAVVAALTDNVVALDHSTSPRALVAASAAAWLVWRLSGVVVCDLDSTCGNGCTTLLVLRSARGACCTTR